MKATITRTDGTKIEAEGTPEEIQRLIGWGFTYWQVTWPVYPQITYPQITYPQITYRWS